MLFIMRGTTLSGKDTFIEKHFDSGAVLSSDQFRVMICGDIHIQQQNKTVFDMLHQVIEHRLMNRVQYTVLNSTNLKYKDANRAMELAKKYKIPYTILSIAPPSFNELVARNEIRKDKKGIDIPVGVIEKHLNRYEASKEPFIADAKNNPLCSYIEFDQDYNVLAHF